MKKYRYRVDPIEIDDENLEAVDLRRERDALPSDEPRMFYAIREYVQEVPLPEREPAGTAILMLWLPHQGRAFIQDGEKHVFHVSAETPEDAVDRWEEDALDRWGGPPKP